MAATAAGLASSTVTGCFRGFMLAMKVAVLLYLLLSQVCACEHASILGYHFEWVKWELDR